MPEQIDSRGTHMTVRPLTPMEMKRWPEAEIAFTIHYKEGPKAHALTKIEDAEEFAQTIRLACVDAKVAREFAEDPEWPKEKMRGRIMFVRCKCGRLYTLSVGLLLCDEADRGGYVCPNCGQNVEVVGEEVSFDDGWGSDARWLLPEFVVKHGKGIHTYYTGLNGQRLRPGG